MNIRNFSIGARSGIAFTVLLVLVVLLGVTSIFQIQRITSIIDKVDHVDVPAVLAANSLEADLQRERLHMRNLFGTSVATEQADYRERMRDAQANLESAIVTLEAVDLGSAESAEFERIRTAFRSLKESMQESMQLFDANRIDEALELKTQEVTPRAETMLARVRSFVSMMSNNVTHDADEAFIISAFSQRLITGVLAVVFVLTVLFAIMFTRSIVGPLREAVQAAESVSRNDLTAAIHVTGRDEPAQLLKALRKMQENLRQSVGDIAQSSEQLAATSEELSAVTEESTRALQEQTDELDQSATAVNELTAAVEEVASNAAGTSDESNEANDKAAHGTAKVNDTTAAIENLNADVETTAEEIANLAKQVEDISSVLDVIRGVSEQTNLLALNAAIEAARAGESGRGFAVVADEVRSLAHRTQDSTTEIETMVSAIQSSSGKAVHAMDSSRNQAQQALAVAREAGGALSEVSQLIAGINERNASIASAAEEQAQVSREVDQSLTRIRDVSTQNAAGANQTSASSQELARLATHLNEIVRRFSI